MVRLTLRRITRPLMLAVCLLPLASLAAAGEANTLSEAEKRAGWKLLFDGNTTDGWRNYQAEDISEGWQVRDGQLVRAEKKAGDIITRQTFGAFELMLDYKISKGGNSGVMFHVTEDSARPWHSGPEVQIQDNVDGHDAQKAGWLYQLYPGETDATKPAGEWNTLYLRIAPDQCAIFMNGVRYSRFKMGTPDWERRVAASKFAKFENFARADEGHICLQDHGNVVAFRNIKIRELDGNPESLNPIDGTLAVKTVPAFTKLTWTDWSPIDESGRVQPLRPIVLTSPDDGTNRIFVATQRGVIHSFPNSHAAVDTNVFLDLSSKVRYDDRQNEEGLLGLAFHPDYRQNGEFVVYYTTTDAPHTSVVSRFRVSADDPNRADPQSEEELLRIEQPFWNHNGGTVAFGPDGYLYVGLGDGGAANDPHGNGQNLGTLLGSILRIDVDKKDEGLNYAIPRDNPFYGQEGARGEIWAHGLRNVWRLAFDSKTGALWAGDVGQNLYEEINIIEKGGNYGWNLREAHHPFGSSGVAARSDLIEPIWEYDHEVGKSITGGVIYRGETFPELQGAYIYGDYVTERIWALKYDRASGRVLWNKAIQSRGLPVISINAGPDGEVYFLVVSPQGRGLFTLAPADS